MAHDVSITMKLYDKMSPTLASIGNSTKAFDKNAQALQQSCVAYEKTQNALIKNASGLRSALESSNQTVRQAQKDYKKYNDEVHKSSLDKAIEDQIRLKSELKDTELAMNKNRKALMNYNDEVRKADNKSDGGGLRGFGKNIAASGLLQMLSGSLGGAASAVLSSKIGEPEARMISGTLSGAASGAATGLVAGPVGAAVGAVLGSLAGGISAKTEIFAQKDQAFQSYVQEQAEGQLSNRRTDIQSGSAIAAGREQDTIAFNQVLGDGVGDQYLEDLRAMAAKTPMEYADLTTMSRSLATGFKDDPERMLGLMTSIGNAGSAVGVDAAGMDVMATAMSRMQSSGKVTMEYLNLIQERGVDAVGMLSDGLGKTKGEIYELISKGKIGGVEAVDIIQAKMDELYGGAMERQAKTFSGLASTLSDAEKEQQNAYGQGYNEVRGKGIAEQTDYLTGESGAKIQEANKAIGAWQAELENSKEQYIRDAQSAVLDSAAYQAAMAAGTDVGYAKAGSMLMEAKVKGMANYNDSDGAKLALESELSLAASIRDNAATNSAYWDAGYRKAQQYSTGLAAGIAATNPALPGIAGDLSKKAWTDEGGNAHNAAGQGWTDDGGNFHGYAYGLNRVPYDNFPALLHQGERVQTASEARMGTMGGINVVMNGTVIREETDVYKVARQFMSAVERARMLAVP